VERSRCHGRHCLILAHHFHSVLESTIIHTFHQHQQKVTLSYRSLDDRFAFRSRVSTSGVCSSLACGAVGLVCTSSNVKRGYKESMLQAGSRQPPQGTLLACSSSCLQSNLVHSSNILPSSISIRIHWSLCTVLLCDHTPEWITHVQMRSPVWQVQGIVARITANLLYNFDFTRYFDYQPGLYQSKIKVSSTNTWFCITLTITQCVVCRWLNNRLPPIRALSGPEGHHFSIAMHLMTFCKCAVRRALPFIS
jgi:hypothetical protein